MIKSSYGVLMLMLLFSSCASIVSKSSYPIIINSNPIRADITISNSSGHVIYAGITPATIRLDAGEKFFKKASYSVKFAKDGYDEKIMPINFKLDGWYWGNILIGGLIGMLIIDPATGAMYKLETEFIYETLNESTTSLEKSEIDIYDLYQIPDDWKDHLVKINK